MKRINPLLLLWWTFLASSVGLMIGAAYSDFTGDVAEASAKPPESAGETLLQRRNIKGSAYAEAQAKP